MRWRSCAAPCRSQSGTDFIRFPLRAALHSLQPMPSQSPRSVLLVLPAHPALPFASVPAPLFSTHHSPVAVWSSCTTPTTVTEQPRRSFRCVAAVHRSLARLHSQHRDQTPIATLLHTARHEVRTPSHTPRTALNGCGSGCKSLRTHEKVLSSAARWMLVCVQDTKRRCSTLAPPVRRDAMHTRRSRALSRRHRCR